MRFPTVLDRYVVRSVMVPGLMAFLVYTFLLMMRAIFGLIEQIFVQGLPATDALRIVGATLPHIVVLTIPLSFLFGVLLAVGRMNGDSEFVAMQAAGISPKRLLPGILILAVGLTAFNAYLFLYVIPRSHNELRLIKTKAFTSAGNVGRIEPKVFYEDFPNTLLYVQDVDQETGVWNNVLVYESSDPAEERLTLARQGRIIFPGQDAPDGSDGAGEPWLLLQDVMAHQFLRNKPSTNRRNAVDQQMVRIRNPSAGVNYQVAIRERATDDLLYFLDEEQFPEDDPAASSLQNRRPERIDNDLLLARIELHRRLAIPTAALVFGLLGLPLGIGSKAGGKGRGFVLSVVVVLVYYILTSNGEVLALKGQIPAWLGMWTPNILLGVIGLFLMGRMGRWLGERQASESVLTRAWRRLASSWEEARARRGRRGMGVGAGQLTGSIPIRIQRRRYSARFPTLFDRHLARRFVTPLILVIVTVISLYVVVDISAKLDDIAKNQVPTDVIVSYYVTLMPQVILDVVPLGMMISVLILLTVLEKEREATAYKSAGISLYRVMLPVLLIACLGVVAMWFLGENVVPHANREEKRLRDVIKGRNQTRSFHASDRLWLLSRDDDNTFYKFLRYDGPTETLIRFTMFRFDEDMRLRFLLNADRAWYENGRWISDSGWFRRYNEDGSDEFEKISMATEIGIPEGPTYFGREFRRPSEMSYHELRSYIETISDSGYKPTKLIVKWHQKTAYPLSALILVMLALPFGLNRGGHRVSTMQGVGIALGLGIGYFLLVALLGKMGEANLLPPVAGAWAPVVLTVLFAVNRMSVLRT